jgi:hypothetical protein
MGNFPKMHGLVRLAIGSLQFGPILGMDTERFEYQHQVAIKSPWKRSNKKQFIMQASF